MKACNQLGPLPTAATLVAALSTGDYERLNSFAELRRRRLLAATGHSRLLAIIEPADLVHQALFQVLLGDAGFPRGRHLSPKNRASSEAFVLCLQGIVNSLLSALVKRAENLIEHVALGDPSLNFESVDPSANSDPHQTLEYRDLGRQVFDRVRRQSKGQPEVQRILNEWETAFPGGDLSPTSDVSRHHYRRARAQLRKTINDLAPEFAPQATDGKEMLL